MAKRGVIESPLRGDLANSGERPDLAPPVEGLLDTLSSAGLDAGGLLAIADALPVMVAFVDRDLTYRFCNKALSRWFERPRGELIGRRMPDVLDARSFEQRRAPIEAALNGQRQSFTAQFFHPTRGLLVTHADYIPHRDSSGHVIGIILIVSDVTEQRLAEQALKESEARFRRIADSTPVPVWVTRRDGSLDFANEEFHRTFEQEDKGALSWRELVHHEDWSRFKALASPRNLPSDGAANATVRMETRQGQRWFEISAQPRRDAEGSIIGHIGAAVDVSVAKEAELSLRSQVEERNRQLGENEDRFRAIFDTVTTLLVLMDTEGRILEVNNTPAPWRNDRMMESIGGFIWDAPTIQDHPEIIPIAREMIAVAQGGETVRRELPLTREGRVVAYLDTVVQPISGTGTTPGHLLLEARDISELRAAQDQLRQSQKMEALGQLTGGLAHDFNNLLTVVVGGLDLIARRTDDDSVRRYATNALSAAERGARLTGQLLAFSRVQRLEIRPVDLRALIEEVRPLLRNVLGPGIDKRIMLGDQPVLIMADPTQVEVAVLNLAINARDAMKHGGTVTISARERRIDEATGDLKPGDYIELAIADTGEGMPQSVVDRAFEPFFTTKDTGKGTGLGLSMVYGMARQSGGTAWIESREGEGTCVSMFFRVANHECLPIMQDETEDSLAHGVATSLKILVVDDDDQVREHLADLLRDRGHRLWTAPDGETGLKFAAKFDPDIVVLDFLMPGMSGAEVAGELLKRKPDQKLLFVSGYSETDAIRAAAPQAPFLAKPFRPEALESALRELLG